MRAFLRLLVLVQVLPNTVRSLPGKAIGDRRLLRMAEGLGRVSIAG